jgi:ABC-type antimicrobial peptide transport system permease subunit
MRRVAVRGLLARKLRSTLTAIAIVLGVAMVSGTLVLTDTIDKAFDSIFSSSYEQTDAVVSGKKLVEWSQTGKAQVSPEVLATVRGLPEVDAAAGTILDLSGDSNQAKILAALVTQSLSKYGVSFSLPLGTLIVFTAVAVIAGILAAIAPARRAARLNVLNALQYE